MDWPLFLVKYKVERRRSKEVEEEVIEAASTIFSHFKKISCKFGPFCAYLGLFM